MSQLNGTKRIGRKKGQKDKYPRIRGIGRVDKDPEAYKAIKDYMSLEAWYNKVKMLRDNLPHRSTKRKWYNDELRSIRYRQAQLYPIIAQNHLVDKLADELGVGHNKPYRRYIRSMKKGTEWQNRK